MVTLKDIKLWTLHTDVRNPMKRFNSPWHQILARPTQEMKVSNITFLSVFLTYSKHNLFKRFQCSFESNDSSYYIYLRNFKQTMLSTNTPLVTVPFRSHVPKKYVQVITFYSIETDKKSFVLFVNYTFTKGNEMSDHTD